MKKVLSLLLALLMLVSVFAFVGCSGEDDPKKTKETVATGEKKTTNTADPNTVLDHEVKDLHGHEFVFVTKENSNSHLATHEVFADVITGDKINDAVFGRNSQLMATYHCDIFETRTDYPTGDYKEALVAGEYVADFFFDSVSETKKNIMTTSLLADLRSLENIHLEKTWYDQGVIEGLTVDGKLFCITGDAATLDDRACWIMYFNKDMINAAMEQSTSGLFDDYKADAENGFYNFVIDGNWTADAMYEIMVASKDDKNGDGTYDLENDVIGYIGENANNYFHLLACGVSVSEHQPNGDITIPDTLPDNILAAWTALKPVLTSEYRYVSDSGAAFRSGHAAFFACNLGSVLNNTTIQVNYGLIPLPKANTAQEHYYAVPSCYQLGVYSIPRTAAKADDAVSNGFTDGVEQAAYFLEAMGYYSVDTLTYAFYDQVISKQLLQDEASKTTLALALEYKMIDPVLLFMFGNLHVAFQQAASPFGANSFGTDIAYDTVTSKYQEKVGNARNELRDWRTSIND